MAPQRSRSATKRAPEEERARNDRSDSGKRLKTDSRYKVEVEALQQQLLDFKMSQEKQDARFAGLTGAVLVAEMKKVINWYLSIEFPGGRRTGPK